ncbi:MAG TPA: DJ-1/PfpI family protein [Candidatus Pelethocola excrementipullorum]|nr:DJ-1/PfpI family protein [Candidatus Pelethocola excrementipullorum]
MKILLLCLKAFEMMEVSPFIDVFGWARDDFDCDIEVVTCGYHKNLNSTFGVSIETNTLIEDVDVNEYAALAIPGGFQEYGFYDEAYHKQTIELIQSFYKAHKPIASVCVAAFPLAKSGILKGKKATTYHLRGGYKRDELEEFGVVLGDSWLEIDENIITSSCPKTAPDVAFELLRILTSEEKMAQVKKAMGY